jgi:RloB-like protein
MPRERKGVSKPASKIQDTRRYFVIASEGADTERIYFEGLQTQIIEQGILDRLIKIEFLARSEPERNQSAHSKVIKALDKYKKTYLLDENDELWLVIDRDKQNNPIKNIAAISQLCEQKGYFMALSNPNFELWLLLHVKDLAAYVPDVLDDFLQNKKVGSSKSMLDTELSKYVSGYNHARYKVEKILLNVEKAIEQAKQLDKNPEDRWIEGKLGTRVYRLVEKILTN